MQNFRKILINIFAILFLFGVSFAIIREYNPELAERIYRPEPCAKALVYEIGNVDPRFNISSDEVRIVAWEAEKIWEESVDRDLFAYEPGAALRINFIFDERQQSTQEAEQLETDLKSLDERRAVLDRQYKGLDKIYDQKLLDFQADIVEHEKRLKKYNQEVARWNEQGGAPEEEYAKMKAEQKAINQNYEKLKKREKELQRLATQINSLGSQENKVVENYNTAIATFQNKYGGSREFEKGVFDPAAGIAVYEFRGMDDLRMTLIHELGHYLGIGHTQDPQSIMHYLMAEQNLDNPVLTIDDVAELKSVCQLN